MNRPGDFVVVRRSMANHTRIFICIRGDPVDVESCRRILLLLINGITQVVSVERRLPART